jgi:hypothetical protein
MNEGAVRVMRFNFADGESAFARPQAEGGNDPLEIVTPVIVDLDSSTFFAVVKRDARAQMLLQSILQVFNCRGSNG